MSEPREDRRSPVERIIDESFIDRSGHGKPLSRRALATPRTVEDYLAAGAVPRFIQRSRDIEDELASHRQRLARAYRALRLACDGDPDLFARRWRERAHKWRFDRVNELIRQHNEYYPIETRLPLNPRTGDYVPIRGRSYRRREIGPQWVLEQFPPSPDGPAPRFPR